METGGGGRRGSHPLFQGSESYSDSRGIPDGTARNLRARFRCPHNSMVAMMLVVDHARVRSGVPDEEEFRWRFAPGCVADGGHADDDEHRGCDESDEDQDAGEHRKILEDVPCRDSTPRGKHYGKRRQTGIADHGHQFRVSSHLRRSFLAALALTARSCCLQCLSFSGMALLWRLRLGLASLSLARCSRCSRSCCSRGPTFIVLTAHASSSRVASIV